MDIVGGVFTLDIRYYLNGFPRALDPEPRPQLFPLELLLGAVESIFSENGRRIDKFSCRSTLPAATRRRPLECGL